MPHPNSNFMSMSHFTHRFLAACGVLLFCTGAISHAQPQTPVPTSASGTSSQTLQVATREIAPFVMKRNGQLTGFSVELWNHISDKLGVKTTWDVKPNVKALVADVQSGKAPIGIAAISITAKREQVIDFSQPMFDSGLQIMTKGQAAQPMLISGVITMLQSPLMIQFVIAILLLIFIPSNILWVIERRHSEGIIRSKSYFPGIFEAVWWTVTCLATQAEEMPRSVFGRVMAVVWMFFAILFTAYVTGTLTASLTVQSLRGDIQGPSDLPGKKVATVTGSTSEDYLKENNVRSMPFATIDKAFEALEAGKVQAVVYDAPILAYYANNEGKGHTQLVGPVFRPESYGIAFSNMSPWRKNINLALLQLREDGTYDDLRTKYFGDGTN